jgi:UDP-glucose 4-epimerase
MNILLTGGLGFIGSHVASILLEKGYKPVILDNLCNSQITILHRLEKMAGRALSFCQGDVRNTDLLCQLLGQHQIHAVMHFAGLKSVSESEADPLKYYDNNVGGTISLLESMKKTEVKKLIFSSSATVYGPPQYLPYDELHPTAPINTYGKTKLQAEEILGDLIRSDTSLSAICLRYFNPVGAHDSGFIGEYPNGIPNNLMPYVCQVASGKLSHLSIFGDDYETPDGTGQRDYIHIMDLAEGHIAAVKFIESNKGIHYINLGSGTPHTVHELVMTFEKTINRTLDKKIEARRKGDLPSCYANPDLAKKLLGWQTKRSLQQMCDSAWNFHCNLKVNN